MASLASINIKFLADLAGFSKQMQNVDRKLQQTGKKLQSVGKSLTVGVTLPIVGIGVASVKAASDAEETQSKFNVVFRDVAKSAQDAFTTLRDEYGLSQQASQQLLSDTGDLLSGFGFSQNAALDLSTQVNKLAVDLASFTNFSGGAEGASQALTKALLGERESVKALGISILEEDVKRQVALNTAKGLTFETERQAKAYATLDLAVQQSGNAIGDYARTQDSFANQFRLLRARLNDLSVSIGQVILPVVNKLTGILSGVVSRLNELSPTTRKWIVILAGVAAAIGPLLALVGTILPALVTGFTILTGPIGLVIAGLVAIGVVIARNWAPIKKTLIDIANYFIDLYNESTIFRIAVEAISNAFKTVFEIGKFAFEFLKNLIGSFADQVVNTFKNIGAAIKILLTDPTNFSGLTDIFKKNLKESNDTFKGFTKELSNDWQTLTGNIETNTKNAIDNALKGKKIDFISEEVNADAVEKVVEDKVAAGAANGLAKALGGAGTGTGKLSFLEQLESDLEDLSIQDSIDLSADVEAITLFDRESADAQMEAFFGAALEASQKFIEDVDEDLVTPFEEKLERMRAIGEIVGAEVGAAFEDMSLGLVNALGLADKGFQGFIKNIAATVIKLISIMLSQSLSQAIAGAVASGTATGPAAIFTTPSFIATAVSGVLAAFAAIPKFESGGIVGGSSFYGDKILARVNSGELILNQDQQKKVFEAMNTQPAFGVAIDGAFKLEGPDLILAIDRSQRKLNRQS